MLASLSLVLVNWNSKDDTLACVSSLLSAGAVEKQIVVVDNGSNDGSVEALHKQFGRRVTVLESGKNLGFTGGVNKGVAFALEQGAEWIFIINNDTIVAPDFFAHFEPRLEDISPFKIFAPLIFYYDEPETVWFLGERLLPGTLFTSGLYKNQPVPAELPEIIPVDFVSGCGMLVWRKVFEDVGFFDTSLFMYGEEVDFCWRARLAGYQMAAVPGAKMWHKVSASANRDRPNTRYLRVRNQIRFYRKYSGGLQRICMFGLVLIRMVWIGTQDVFKQQFDLLRPLAQGWWDGWWRHSLDGDS